MTVFSQDLNNWSRQTVIDARRALAEAEIGPSLDTLSASPCLDVWQPIQIGTVLCLAGAVSGHPLLPDTFIATSPLVALCQDAAWARTISRFYRLGPPLDTALGGKDGRDLAIVGAYGYPAVTLAVAQVWLAHITGLIRQRTDN